MNIKLTREQLKDLAKQSILIDLMTDLNNIKKKSIKIIDKTE